MFRDSLFIAYANAQCTVSIADTAVPVFSPSVQGGTVRIQSIEELISYLNNCISKVHTKGGLGGLLDPPSFVWNAATRLIELWVPMTWVPSPLAPIIFFSKELNNVLMFPHYQMSGPAYDYPFPAGTLTGDGNWVAIRTVFQGRTQPAQISSAYVMLSQVMNRQSAISDLSRILLLSTGVGVSGNQQGANSSTPCLTDFVPDTSTIVFGDPLIYTPAFYRWYTVDTPPSQLDRINLRVQYETVFGEAHDIMVNPGDHFSILLVFEETV
jgi:hypothetical protein